MLNSTEHKIYHAHLSLNANNCWHFNVYKHDIYNICVLKEDNSLFLNILIFILTRVEHEKINNWAWNIMLINGKTSESLKQEKSLISYSIKF